MTRLARTWWGERLLDVLQDCMDSGRLARGRSYAGPSRILEFDINGSTVTARVRGNINPYFGVRKEPRYTVKVSLKQFSSANWEAVTDQISQNAAFLSQLMVNEMPPTIEDAFAGLHSNLLPREKDDLVSNCSCPDYASPCKHVAGVYYKIASMLDRDPLLLFQLRGMSFAKLRSKLEATPLGQALLDQRGSDAGEVDYRTHLYTAPHLAPLNKPELKSFWQGREKLPEVTSVDPAMLKPAILVRKGGHLPPFWEQPGSFIDAMEAVYTHILAKNKKGL